MAAEFGPFGWRQEEKEARQQTLDTDGKELLLLLNNVERIK